MKLSCITWTASIVLAIGLSVPVDGADEEADFKPIFDGKSLDGWDGNLDFWSVRDSVITGRTTKEKPTKGNTFLIWRQGELDDFELRLSFRIVGGNSGVQYRSKDLGNWVVGGYQADFDAGGRFAGILYDEKGRGILAQRGKKVTRYNKDTQEIVDGTSDDETLLAAIKREDWNDYVIVARGNHLVQKINGLTTIEFVDREESERDMSGILALQLHAGPPMTVQFKDLRLKRLPLKDRKKIVIVAGTPSHAPGEHEFNAGCLLLQKCLAEVSGVHATVYRNGWPKDPTAFDNADSLLMYLDGGSRHPAIQGDRLAQVERLVNKGVGLACGHYAVEVPKDRGGPEFLAWIGGYYETGFSTNPHWTAEFKQFPEHSITRGVRPFAINDEWYFNIRMRPTLHGVKAILKATPPDEVRRTEAARQFKGREEILAWAVERPDGGRGFGFTGGHVHNNWGDENYRKLFLNALLWTAGADVPAGGVPSHVTPEELKQNLDPKDK